MTSCGSRDGTTRGPLRITDGPNCKECSIALDTLVTLGDPNDIASPRPDAAVVGCVVGVTDDGHYLLSGVVGGGEILVYDGPGAAVRSIGRHGEGPGEFGKNLRILVARGDTIFVIDDSNYRVVAMDLDGRVLESFRLPNRVHSIVRLGDGGFIMHSRPVSNDTSERLFRRLDATGSVVASFGRSTRAMAEKDQWVLGNGHTLDYWAASMWEYKLYRGVGDSLTLAVVRDADWFPSGAEWSAEILETKAPPPLLTHLYEDPAGLIWTYVTLADPDWRADIPDAGSVEWTRQSFDTMVEVLDVQGGHVLAQYRSDDWLAPVCGTRLVYAVVPTAEGDTRITVLEPHLER